MSVTEQRQELKMTMLEYLPNFIKGVDQIVLWIHEGNELEAIEALKDAVEGLSWLIEAKSLVDVSHSEEEMNALNTHLRGITEALVDGDTIMIADLLEYELKPVMIKWHQEISERDYA
ncbi:hypothetical protein ACR6HW_09710 [Fusibacter sp. JL298sf-3]